MGSCASGRVGKVAASASAAGTLSGDADADADADAEQAAIDAGQIKAGCLWYAGRVRPAPDRSAARLDEIAER